MNAQMILTIFLLFQETTDVTWLEKLADILSYSLLIVFCLLIISIYKIFKLKKEIKTLQDNNIKLGAIGNIASLPKKAQTELAEVMAKTQNNNHMNLTLALSYGSREEIIHAFKSIGKRLVEDDIKVDDISEDLINKHLYTSHLPDVDLMIRTSGEQRISNFLLWQIAYAELYFTDILWPDFRKDDLLKAIHNYQNRERRFGKTSEQLS